MRRNNDFRVSVLALSPETQIRFPPQQLSPKLYSRPLEDSRPGEKMAHWEVGANFQKVPVGEAVDIIYEHISPGLFLRKGAGSTTLAFEVEAETVELTRWLLLPQGKQYRHLPIDSLQDGQARNHGKCKGRHRILGRRLHDSRIQASVG